jgi:hypothetical protein
MGYWSEQAGRVGLPRRYAVTSCCVTGPFFTSPVICGRFDPPLYRPLRILSARVSPRPRPFVADLRPLGPTRRATTHRSVADPGDEPPCLCLSFVVVSPGTWQTTTHHRRVAKVRKVRFSNFPLVLYRVVSPSWRSYLVTFAMPNSRGSSLPATAAQSAYCSSTPPASELATAIL